MLKESRQQAWFHGLPGFDVPGGVAVEVINFIPPKPEPGILVVRFINWLFQLLRIRLPSKHNRSKLNVTIVTSPDLRASLQKLSASRTAVSRLSLVIRTDRQQEPDNEYEMADAIVESVLPLENIPTATTVDISYNSITWQMGWSNPGPPPNAPEVREIGDNTGWVFGMSRDRKRGIPCNIVSFVPPCFDGKLTVTFGKPSSEIQSLLQSQIALRELILVLPDRTRKCYVEYKLWNARVSMVKKSGEQKVVFESDTIGHFAA